MAVAFAATPAHSLKFLPFSFCPFPVHQHTPITQKWGRVQDRKGRDCHLGFQKRKTTTIMFGLIPSARCVASGFYGPSATQRVGM